MAIKITTPLSDETVRSLHAGDNVLISGILYTGRDAVHKYLADGGELPPEVNLDGGIIYHCGPVVVEKDENGTRHFKVTAAGPTTSIREEPYQAGLIARYKIRGVIGKGGMGLKTLAACKENGAVYLHAIGGAAQVLRAGRDGRKRCVFGTVRLARSNLGFGSRGFSLHCDDGLARRVPA